MTREECLKVLGLDASATESDIKKAYRKLANKYHPDKENGDSEKFVEVSEAYKALKNNDFSVGGGRGYYYNHAAGHGAGPNPFEEFEDYIRRHFGDNFDFGDIFGNRGHRASHSEIVTTYVITLDDIYHGNSIRTAKHGNIAVPRGVYDNEIFTTDSKDNSKIKFRVSRHPIYTRKSNRSPDLTTTVTVSTIMLAIGGTITLEHFDDTLEVDVQSGISPSTVIRVKEAGLPVFNQEGKFGDLYIRLNAITPELNQKEKKKLKKLFGNSLDVKVKK